MKSVLFLAKPKCVLYFFFTVQGAVEVFFGDGQRNYVNNMTITCEVNMFPLFLGQASLWLYFKEFNSDFCMEGLIGAGLKS